ncbi:MAG TPA: baseplate J/gp47 family protein [Chloroflexota bacterium]
MSFRKRGFQEIVDDILTELTGGVVNESLTFRSDGATPAFELERTPVARITSVTGTVQGDFHQFSDTDFQVSPDRTGIRWLQGTRPDDDSSFFVDYYPDDARSPVTDRNVGSVARTLVESIGREFATLYEQMDLVHRSGFIDLAEGAPLEFVVALLGLKRIRAGREVGEVVFSRGTPAPGDITIPLGTIVATPPLGEKQETFEFETTATRTLRQGQTEIGVPIRFLPPERQSGTSRDSVPAGAINLIPKPIVGIERVTNPEATSRGVEDETDEQLRQRARKALAEAGKSTSDALRAAVLSHGPGVNVVVQDMPSGVPGEVKLVIDGADDARRRAAILESILATKAAGVIVSNNFSDSVALTLKLRLETRDDVVLTGDDIRRLEDSIKAAIVAYVNGLRSGEAIARNALVALSLADARLRSVDIEALTTHREGLVDDTATRLREAGGNLTSLATFDHVGIGQLEKAQAREADVSLTIATGAPEVAAGVRLTVTLAGNPTPLAIQRGVGADAIQPQIETLVRGFVESPERGITVRLGDVIAFVEQGSGLFTVRPLPNSFLVAEHLATGQVDRNVDTVSLGEKEQVELKSLVLTLSV